MKNYFIYPAILAMITLTAQPSCGEVVDRIEVVINNEVITEAEINRMVAPVYEQYRTMYQGDQLIKKLEEARQKIVAQIIEDKLILSEAKKLNIEVDEKDVSDRIDNTIKRFGSRQSFEKGL
ncbi:MAG: SurA N-terminal domain-containing protein, partial [Candidatus Omnitrophota bacterium]|nr:SurA N-terminal domain-containing protein [Candidatus Omnitrophota bacterium]